MPKLGFFFAETVKLTKAEAAAITFAEELRWRDEITCHRCGSSRISRLTGRPGDYRGTFPKDRHEGSRRPTETEAVSLTVVADKKRINARAGSPLR